MNNPLKERFKQEFAIYKRICRMEAPHKLRTIEGLERLGYNYMSKKISGDGVINRLRLIASRNGINPMPLNHVEMQLQMQKGLENQKPAVPSMGFLGMLKNVDKNLQKSRSTPILKPKPVIRGPGPPASRAPHNPLQDMLKKMFGGGSKW